jgi:hypothetical protein
MTTSFQMETNPLDSWNEILQFQTHIKSRAYQA